MTKSWKMLQESYFEQEKVHHITALSIKQGGIVLCIKDVKFLHTHTYRNTAHTDTHTRTLLLSSISQKREINISPLKNEKKNMY